MKRFLLAAALTLALGPAALAQTINATRIDFTCRSSAALSKAGHITLWPKCADHKLYISKDGGAFTELGGASGAPDTATYITQTANGSLSNEQALASLATGILKNTTTTGVLSIATGSDLPSHTHAEADVTSLVSDLAAKAPLASPTFTGTVTMPTPFTLGATSVLPTGTELNYVDGVTSPIQTQLDAKAPLASPALTGDPSVPTATAGDNDTSAASTAFVTAAEVTRRQMRELWSQVPFNTATTFTGVGSNATVTGTGGTAAYLDSDGAFLNITSAATTSSVASAALGGVTRADWLPDLTIIWKDQSPTENNYIEKYGLSNNVNDTSNGSNAIHIAVFRCDTSTDTNYQACVKDGTTLSCSDTGVAARPGSNTQFVGRIVFTSASSVSFYLNGSLVATKSSNTPGATISLGWTAIKITTENVAKNLRVRRAHLLTK